LLDARLRGHDVFLAMHWCLTYDKRQCKHATKAGKMTVPDKLFDAVPIGTLKSILRQAGLEK